MKDVHFAVQSIDRAAVLLVLVLKPRPVGPATHAVLIEDSNNNVRHDLTHFLQSFQVNCGVIGWRLCKFGTCGEVTGATMGLCV